MRTAFSDQARRYCLLDRLRMIGLSTVQMIQNGTYALVCYVLGVVAIVRTDWVTDHAVRMQRKYPKALSSRIAERAWYPNFIRSLGAILLLFAGISTLKLVFQALAYFDRLPIST